MFLAYLIFFFGNVDFFYGGRGGGSFFAVYVLTVNFFFCVYVFAVFDFFLNVDFFLRGQGRGFIFCCIYWFFLQGWFFFAVEFVSETIFLRGCGFF